jgi:hypothetical protein
MRKSRSTDKQIVAMLRDAERASVAETAMPSTFSFEQQVYF